MPARDIIFANDQIYHIYNRGLDRRPTFTTKREYQRALWAISYYQYKNPPLRLSKLFQQAKAFRQVTLEKLKKEGKKQVSILAYCLMPNHFHLLLKQNSSAGISKFMSDFQNSYTRYFNTRHERKGSLFLGQFKAVRVETEEQLVHVSRYIHLNPYSTFLIRDLRELENYPWSSFSEYLHPNSDNISEPEFILNLFGVNNIQDYKKFVFDRADYQRSLEEIKHLALE